MSKQNRKGEQSPRPLLSGTILGGNSVDKLNAVYEGAKKLNNLTYPDWQTLNDHFRRTQFKREQKLSEIKDSTQKFRDHLWHKSLFLPTYCLSMCHSQTLFSETPS